MDIEGFYFSYLFLYLIWPHQEALGILVSLPGIEPGLLGMRILSPNHWVAREFPYSGIFRGRTFLVLPFRLKANLLNLWNPKSEIFLSNVLKLIFTFYINITIQ